MQNAKVLIQLDADEHPSSFDSIVALDAGVDQLLRYSQLDELKVPSIVHGAMFTRGPEQLNNTAIYIGGSDVHLAQRLLKHVQETFFGPFRVSVMLDPNGANTTAVAAVRSASQHISFSDPATRVLVLGGTGPVGRRIALLTAQQARKLRWRCATKLAPKRPYPNLSHRSRNVTSEFRRWGRSTPAGPAPRSTTLTCYSPPARPASSWWAILNLASQVVSKSRSI